MDGESSIHFIQNMFLCVYFYISFYTIIYTYTGTTRVLMLVQLRR